MSSMAVDAGYIVLPPLAAAIYKAVGRSPLAGIAAVFAGVGAGFNANLLVTGLDPLLAGLTEAAANILDPSYKVNAACNLYFMIASTVLITIVAWGVTALYVEPRLSRKRAEDGGPGGEVDEASLRLVPGEKRGLVWAAGAIVLTMVAIYLNIAMPWGVLYDEPGVLASQANPDLQGRICAVAPLVALQSGLPFPVSFAEPIHWVFRLGQQAFATWVTAIVPLLVLLFFVPGMAYGIAAGSIRNDRDVVKMMSEYMSILGNYIVLAFFAAIFVAAFEHSNLGKMLAIEGGNFLRQFDLHDSVFMVAFIFVVMGINMFIGSMSAKWAMLATVFVPMFMTLGISPELTQVTYRIGDSVTNSISPLNPYIVVLLVFMQQHAKKAGLGTLISMMLPYAIVLAVAWSLLLVAWITLGFPVGVDGPLSYTP
jgi:aminobenzoyl-glutamate transport protein